ncbi:MAG TPA: nucleotide sugar dehydrogenase, partial [bacterium]|nr:nucleotide sugar dehydrogenase [bacterium]
MTLKQKIEAREARIGVLGLGYVGLPLLIEYVEAGFDCTGFDVDEKKIERLKAKQSYIRHIPAEKIAGLFDS